MEKKSKLVLAVLQGSDSDNTIRNLNEQGFMVTVLSSTGGFLKKKSTTVMIGVEEDRLDPYFSSVVLSSVCHLRKPGAEIYRIALRELGVEPGECVSVADNIKRDITGAKEAGIGCNVIFRSPEKKHPVVFTEENRPDAVISRFTELLDLLPALN